MGSNTCADPDNSVSGGPETFFWSSMYFTEGHTDPLDKQLDPRVQMLVEGATYKYF